MKMRETSRDTDKKPCVNNYLTWANQVRLLQLNIQSLASTIGQGLIAAVLPAIQTINALFSVLMRAAEAFRDFMYVLTGYEGKGSQGGIINEFAGIGDAVSGVEDLGSAEDSATDSAKKLKKALSVLPFDQLNQLSDSADVSSGTPSGGGTGGGISGSGLSDLGNITDAFGKSELPNAINEWAERIRAAFLAGDWENLGFEIADGLNKGLQKVYDVISWDNVGPKITAFTTAFTETFNSFVDSFDFELLGRTIGTGINTVVNTLNQLIDGIDWINLGNRFADGFMGLVDEVDWFELGRLIGNKFMIAWDTLLGFVTTLDWGEVGRSLADGFNGIFQEISLGDIGTTIGTIVAGIIEMFREFFANVDWPEVANQVKEGITNALEAASDGGKNDGILAGLLGIGAIAGISKVISPVIGIVKKLTGVLGGGKGLAGVGSKIASIFGSGGTLAKGFNALKSVIGGISLPVTIVVGVITALAAGIKDLWDTSESFRSGIGEIWDNICQAFTDAKIQIWDDTLLPLWENIQGFFDAIGGLFDTLYSMYESSGAKGIFEDIVLFFADLGGGIVGTTLDILSDFFSAFYGLISAGIGIVTGFIEIIDGALSGDWSKIWEGAEDIVYGVVDGIESLLDGLWGAIKSIFSPVIAFFDDVFSGAYNAVKNAWQYVSSWFQEKWNAVKKVFSPVIDFFKTAFGNAYTGVKNIWNAVNSWFQEKWNAVKNVFSSVKTFFSEKFTAGYNAIKSAFQSIGSWFGSRWSDIKNVFGNVKTFFRDAFKGAYDAVTSVWNGIGGFFKGIANSAIKPIGNLVNGIIDGINWVGDKLGVGRVLNNWSVPQFASGSKGIRKDTFGVVNDQKGATYKELILPPNGKPFIPKGRNVMLPLQKGTKIMPAGQTEELMKLMKIPRFAGGIGDFFGGAWSAIKSFAGDVWNYLTHPGDLVKVALDKFIKLGDFFEPWLTIAGGAINRLFDGVVDFISGLFDKATPEVNYNPSAGVEQWRGVAAQALRMEGQYSEANLNRLLMQMQTESSGNPNAINNWDINAKRGTPSKGLMQVIDPTFRAYARPGYDKNIWDPLSNILASIRYTVRRYGSLANGWRGHAYAEGIGKISFSDILGDIPFLARGGIITAPTLALTGENFRKEAVLPLENRRSMQMIANSIVENSDGLGLTHEELAQTVAEGVAMAMMNNGGNQPNITVYAELKTESDEVLARAVTRGQNKLDYRKNPTAQFGY